MSPMKKRKIQSDFPDTFPPTFLSDVIGEVDHEIALKQQLTETLESRIAWALMLKESITKPTGNASSSPSEYAFRNDALEALAWGEQNSEYILQGDPIPPPAVDHDRTVRAAARKQSYPINNNTMGNGKPKKPPFLYTRANPLATAININNGTTTTTTTTANADKNGTYILKCPECSRTAFTALQGLLNHARLAHNLEWGTHENCIRSCAVYDDGLDLEAGIEVSGAPASIPALRDLFQRAVGSQDVGKEKLSRQKQASSDGPRSTELQASGEQYLVKTLGFHGESPALAPYLGKESIRREIKVWDEDMDVDISSGNDSNNNKHPDKRRWKMPFTPRNFVENSVAGSGSPISKSEQPPAVHQNLDNEAAGFVAENVAADQSRFHFIARIVITDRSLWIPLAKRAENSQQYTHKWMISVDSPAYTRHITSVLNSVKVVPSDSTVDAPSSGSASNPPFAVIGFANRPFLAKVELSFSGTSSFQKESRLSEQKVTFEHWVDLDLGEHRDPYDGQDQVLDVELDKNTILKPPQLKYTPIRSKSLWDRVTLSSILDSQEKTSKIEEMEEENKKHHLIEEIKKEEDMKEIKKENEDEDGMEGLKVGEHSKDDQTQDLAELPPETLSVLNRCVKKFPMILPGNDLSEFGPQSSAIPYRPVPSREYYNALTLGRQRAIEWGRALAIRDAYTEEMQNRNSQNFLPLTVARVYLWMSDNGHFIRRTKTLKKDFIEQRVSNPLTEKSRAESDGPTPQWCPICGLEADLHRKTKVVKMEHLEDEDEAKGSGTESYRGDATHMSEQECHIVPSVLQIAKLPRVIPSGLSSDDDPPATIPQTKNYMAFNRGSLVATADPRLVLSIHKLMEGLMLSKLCPSTDHQENLVPYPIDAFGKRRMDVEDTLSIPALLAHLTKQFIHVLIKDGLEVAKRDKIIASGMLPSGSRRGNRSAAQKRLKTSQLLTPTHILSGVLTRGRGRGSSRSGMDTVVLSSLSNMGVTVEYNDQLIRSRQGESESNPTVKLESD